MNEQTAMNVATRQFNLGVVNDNHFGIGKYGRIYNDLGAMAALKAYQDDDKISFAAFCDQIHRAGRVSKCKRFW